MTNYAGYVLHACMSGSGTFYVARIFSESYLITVIADLFNG
jgi:hypothetical protein